ncbi:MAG TPA: hypothetical protein VE596_13610 [Gaiellaceae bacterium]|nr:hypothetical protein [Gaiellaceae bacterium]
MKRGFGVFVAALLLLTASVPDTSLGGSAQPLHRYRNGRIAFAHLEQVAPSGLAAVGATGTRRSLILGGVLVERPVVSPDGSRVACVVGASSPSVYVVRSDRTHRVRIGAGRSPSWSPDGSRLAFVTPRNEIEVAAADGSGVRSLGVAGLELVWSPKGDRIAFLSSDSVLELIRPDGSGRTVLATDAYQSLDFLRLAWSHDGAWLSFGAVNPETHVLELNVMRPDGSDRRSLGNGSAVAWSPTENVIAFATSVDGIGMFELVTPDGSVRMRSQEIWGTPAWSPDGRTVAVGDPDQQGVAIVDARTGAVRNVAIRGVPAWSRDGTRIAAVRGLALFVVAVAGGRAHVVARGAVGGPFWLRGGRIAYVTLARVRSVLATAAPGGSARILLRGPTTFSTTPRPFTALAWSPDGSRLAFVREAPRRNVLGVVSANGTDERVLARGVTDVPTWSPNGKLVAFAANGLSVVRASGGPVRRLARGRVEAPEWSPDGHYIAFLQSDKGYALFSIDPNGRHLRRLAVDVFSTPSWSPDGRRIAFSTGASYEPTAIATVRPDGTGLRTLVAAAAAEETGDVLSRPAWSPDGRTILYTDEEYLCGSKCSEVNLMAMRQDGTHRRQLRYYVGGATWSPDGRQLLGENGEGRLVAVDFRTGKPRLVGRFASAWSWQPLRSPAD